jgi:chromosome segregation ATPase
MSLENTISRLENKLAQLLENYQSLKSEKLVFEDKLKSLEQTLELQKNSIKDLEEKNNLVKIAGNIPMDESDKKEIKHKISKVIQEIDECIAALSR